MVDDKILSSDKSENHSKEKLLTSEKGLGSNINLEEIQSINIIDRIRKSTQNNGLGSLPVGFDEQNGDWVCINSIDPFEILYLDYQQYKFITPEIVKNNYSILEKFWKDKVGVMNTGGNRVAFKNKYGDGTIENALQKLKKAFEKLSTELGIENYFTEINNARLKEGAKKLQDNIDGMLVDGEATKDEIELCLQVGLKHDLKFEETAEIIKRELDKKAYKPYGNITGITLIEQLFSVTWMTEFNIQEQIKIDEEKKKRGREIFDNTFAYSIDEIGTILFTDEGQAKEYIHEGLVVNSIDYFSSSKAKQIIEINKIQENVHLKYLQIVYRLNPKLPYKFDGKIFSNIKELSFALFENPEIGKEHFKQGNIEIWLQECQTENFKKLIKIKDTDLNIDLKYLELLYTFNPGLPYSFNNINYSDLNDLCLAFFENPKMGKENFQQGNIEIWLKECQPENYVKLIKIRDTAENVDLAFLELLYTFNPKLPYRFSSTLLVKTPLELCNEIDKSKENWTAGKEELFNSSILIWLKATGKLTISDMWDKVKEQYLERKDDGLELFLHLLNEKLEYPLLEISEKNFSFPSIQSGDKVIAGFVLNNKTRGFIDNNLAFSKILDGVNLSPKKFSLNSAAGVSNHKVNLTIDSNKLLKGVDYRTDIQINTSYNKTISIPVSFKLVFPRNAFIKEIIKYAVLFALLGGIIRGAWLFFGFRDWLKASYQYYLLRTDIYWQEEPAIYYFPLIFIILIVFVILIIWYWKKVIHAMDKI